MAVSMSIDSSKIVAALFGSQESVAALSMSVKLKKIESAGWSLTYSMFLVTATNPDGGMFQENMPVMVPRIVSGQATTMERDMFRHEFEEFLADILKEVDTASVPDGATPVSDGVVNVLKEIDTIIAKSGAPDGWQAPSTMVMMNLLIPTNLASNVKDSLDKLIQKVGAAALPWKDGVSFAVGKVTVAGETLVVPKLLVGSLELKAALLPLAKDTGFHVGFSSVVASKGTIEFTPSACNNYTPEYNGKTTGVTLHLSKPVQTPTPVPEAPAPKAAPATAPAAPITPMQGTPVDLAQADMLGQPVQGTSPGSIYYAVALSKHVKVAVREVANGVSIRIAGDALHLKNLKDGLHSMGFTDNGSYISAHINIAPHCPASRIVGAVLHSMDYPFTLMVTGGSSCWKASI